MAITAHRITSITDSHITFRYKDYQDGSKQKLMTLSHEEFVRRFEQHILPRRYVKIRHAGFMSHQGKTDRIRSICQQLHLPLPMPKVKVPLQVRMMIKTGKDITACRKCKTGHYQVMDTIIHWNGEYVSVHDIRSRGQPVRANEKN